jgi:hypothetical protein
MFQDEGRRQCSGLLRFIALTLRLCSYPFYNTPPCEAPMPFSIRPCSPVLYSVSYNAGPFRGKGTVWNLSCTGWRLSGDLPLRIGEVCSLTVNLSIESCIYVAAGIVRWVRGEEYGVETLVIDDESRVDMEQYVCQRVEDKWIAFRARRTARPRN